jgi:hypothetical protein
LTNYHKRLDGVLGGHVVGFDFINQELTLYEATLKGVIPSVILQQDFIPFEVLGEVVVRYERNAMQEIYTLINGNNTFQISYNTALHSRSTGAGYDRFGLVFLNGDIIVTEAQYSSQLPKEPDILILGDSVVNGDTIRNLSGWDYEVGGLFGTLTPANSNEILYLVNQIDNETNLDLLSITFTITGGAMTFVQYRDDGTNLNLINSKVVTTGLNDVSDFIFRTGDWIGFIAIGISAGGVKYKATGGRVLYLTGESSISNTIAKSSFTEVDFTFRFRLVTS